MSKERENSVEIWTLTDGKIGDEVQCRAIAGALAEALGGRIANRTAPPRRLVDWTAPWGPVDPRDAPGAAGSFIAPPFPGVLVASGRRAAPYARAIRRASGGRTFVVMLKDPRLARGAADLLWAPAHDRVAGPNVFSTLTAPHGLGPAIEAARAAPIPAIAALASPLLGVVLGGPSGGARYDDAAADDLAARLGAARKAFAALAVTPSRRTPPEFVERLGAGLSGEGAYVWDGEGENPYVSILARSAALVVAADSHNMMSEAAAAPAGVYAWRPAGLVAKMAWFTDELQRRGAAREFDADAAPFDAAAVDATDEIARAIRERIRKRAARSIATN